MIGGAFSDALQTGLPYSLAFLGVWMTFRLQGEFDLTVENSFTLGAAVFGTWVTHGGHAIIGFGLAIGAGGLAGLATYTLRRVLGLSLILASIIVSTGLFSLNLRIMNQPDLNLFGVSNLITAWTTGISGGDQTAATIELAALIAFIAFAGVMVFLRTELGLILRTNGLNRAVVRSNGGSPERLLLLAVVGGNALVAASGGLLAMQEGFVDVSMGIGTLVAAATAILIGETLVGAHGPTLRGVLGVLVGAIAYRFMLSLAFRAGVDPTYFQGVTAILVVAVLATKRGTLGGINALRGRDRWLFAVRSRSADGHAGQDTPAAYAGSEPTAGYVTEGVVDDDA